MPFCDGIFSVGSGASNSTVGMIFGTTPNMAYLARITATRASIGIAGNGVPLKSMRPITAREVHAGHRQHVVRGIAARRDLLLRDDAVHQHVRRAVDGGHDERPQDRRQRPAGREEDRVQRRTLAEHELQPEAARLAALGRVGDLDGRRDRPAPRAAAAPARPGPTITVRVQRLLMIGPARHAFRQRDPHAPAEHLGDF